MQESEPPGCPDAAVYTASTQSIRALAAVSISCFSFALSMLYAPYTYYRSAAARLPTIIIHIFQRDRNLIFVGNRFTYFSHK